MRVVLAIAFVVLGASCSQLLGLQDPKPAPDAPGVTPPGPDGPHAPSDGQAPSDGGTDLLDATPLCLEHAQASSDGHSYFLTQIATDWDDAEASCLAVTGHLVKIETAAQNAFIVATLVKTDAWIGLIDAAGLYVWIDGTVLGSYNDFVTGTPPGTGRECVAMDAKQWNDLDCMQGMPGVCECE